MTDLLGETFGSRPRTAGTGQHAASSWSVVQHPVLHGRARSKISERASKRGTHGGALVNQHARGNGRHLYLEIFKRKCTPADHPDTEPRCLPARLSSHACPHRSSSLLRLRSQDTEPASNPSGQQGQWGSDCAHCWEI